jgi:Tetratricopeptide repeat
MSLIHSALKQMDAQPTLAVRSPSALPKADQSLAKNVVFAFAGLAAVVAIAAAIWLVLFPEKMPFVPKPSVAQLPVAVGNSPVKPSEVTPPVMVPASTSPPAIKDVPIELTQPAAVAVEKTSQAVKVIARQSEVVERTAPVDKQLATANASAAKARPIAIAEPAPAEMSVDKSLALFLKATSSNDMIGALEQLKAVQQQTPPGNVSRVRAEAWYALRTGDIAGAKRGYADILDRLPDDEEASINLASLEAREGRGEAARQLLAAALRSHPDSEALRDALKRFKAPAGN